MRKHAFLFVLISIFSLTSCDLLNGLNFNGPRRRSSKEESELVEDSYPNSERNSSSREQSSIHVHHYGEWIRVIEPTCTEQGMEERVCECGEKQTRALQAYGHSFIEFFRKEPTCFSPGYYIEQCNRCHEQRTVDISPIEHNYVEAFARADEGMPKILYMQCSNCQGGALRWDATEYDTELTTGTVKVDSQDDFSGIRFGTVQYSNENSDPGTHIFYKIYSPIACNDLTLSFFIRVHNSSFNYPVFDNYENDSNFGYEIIDGEYVKSDKRYGLKVNDQQIPLGEDYTVSSAPDPRTISWYRWPVSFNLLQGINIIEMYALGGYRPIIQTFQIERFGNNLFGDYTPTPTHEHTVETGWSHDENQHWHRCIDPNCPYPNIKIDASTHTWGERYDDVPSTCYTKGSYKVRCAVCGFERTFEIPQLEHNWQFVESIAGDDILVGYQTYTCSIDHATKISIPALAGTLSPGASFKSSDAVGFMKLSTNGSSISYNFNYNGQTTSARLLIRALMDDWAYSKNVGFYKNSYGGPTVDANPNVEFNFNGNVIDLSDKKDYVYNDFLAGGEQVVEGNYSPVDCIEIGQIELNQGVNTLVYSRLASYNLQISDFIIIID